MKLLDTDKITVLIRGGGDMASGVAWRLYKCGFRVFMTEIPKPLAIRRSVCFCEAVYEQTTIVEGVEARLVDHPGQAQGLWEKGVIPLMVDPDCNSKEALKPHVLVDAIMAKKNLGTSISDAPLVIALGPGFEAGKDAHYVVETKRGHYLGRLIENGPAAPDTGIPGQIMGYGSERVLRAPAQGKLEAIKDIGDQVAKGEPVCLVGGHEVLATIDGVIRGLIRPGLRVTEGLKIGDIDPRGIREHCFTISEKALAIAGSVLEGILRTYCRTQAEI